MWMSNTAACALMLGIAGSILARVPPGDGLRKSLLVGIAFSANLGGIATPIGSPPNAIALRYLEAAGRAPDFLTWMLATAPLVVVLVVLLLVVLVRRWPTQVTEVVLPEEARTPLDRAQIFTLLVVAITIAGWLLGGMRGVTAGTVALLPVLAFFATDLLGVQDLRKLPWDVLMLIGGGLALGAAIEQSGLATWMGARLPLHGSSDFVVIGVVVLLTVVLGTVMSNTATANVVLPLVASLKGVPSGSLLVAVALAASLSMALPVSTPPNAMAFAHGAGPDGKGELSSRDLIGMGVTITVAGLVVLALLVVLWLPLFGFDAR
jgi:sodium-dependent dicarboxylate transporter 2/3/5